MKFNYRVVFSPLDGSEEQVIETGKLETSSEPEAAKALERKLKSLAHSLKKRGLSVYQTEVITAASA